jgi:two-component system cell cycle response regulator
MNPRHTMHSDDLQAENLALRQQLQGLLREARTNEDKMQRFDQLEHRLIRLLLDEYKLAFGVEFVTLALLDLELETTRALEADGREDAKWSGLTLLQSPLLLQGLYGQHLRPRLGPFDAVAHGPLFNASPTGTATAIRSVALLPLSRHGELIGSLHFGSPDLQRYDHASGTQLLERLAALVSVCLESALNLERLKMAGLTDVLTGVHNRRYFQHRCQIEISQARRYQYPLACLFLDIDKFKSVNDSYGHPAGDAVLRTVGQVIQCQLRAGDTIARYGGEEFIVLLPRAPALHAREIAERIRSSIADQTLQAASPNTDPDTKPQAGSTAFGVTISIGLSMLANVDAGRDQELMAERLVAASDKALYRAKQEGRNRVVYEGG